MESRDASKYCEWSCDPPCNFAYLDTCTHMSWPVCIVSKPENGYQTGYFQLALWSSLMILDAYLLYNGLLAGSTHSLVFHRHYACSHILLPLWPVLGSQMMFSLGEKPAKCCKSSCSEASCLCIWVDSRKSLENSWVKIRQILLLFSDIVFNFHYSY